MTGSEQDPIEVPSTLVTTLVKAEQWVVMTGSGISAESGVPTFRDAQTGLWAQYDPQQLATQEAFKNNPHVVWQWYQWRRELIRNTSPNPAHRALVELQRLRPNLILVTQNVDGLHQRAGSTNVIEFHGNIHRNKCSHCQKPGPESEAAQPPDCAHCGELLRPNVVWFGESIPRVALQAAANAIETCDVFFSVGTSSLVYPAAALAETALTRQAVVVEINLNPTPLSSRADFALQGLAGQWLPAITDLVRAG